MEKLALDICKRSEGFEYGHTDKRVKEYEELLNTIEKFFAGKKLVNWIDKIIGIKVSNSGCNIWLKIYNHGRMNNHRIYTTQNDHLVKFGITPLRTDLQRFIK